MRNNITEKQRYQIEILLSENYSVKQIADVLGHKYHTIYQEIKRGTVKQLSYELEEIHVYKADYAQMVRDTSCSNRGRNYKIGNDLEFVHYIEYMVKDMKYSPEALLEHAKRSGLQFSTTLCVKTIYNYFDNDMFLNCSTSDLPIKRKQKKNDNSKKSSVSLNNKKGRSIEERPKDILDRNVYGHWEMDTVVSGQSKGKSCLLVLSERMTREEIIIKINDKKSSSVVSALDRIEKYLGTNNFREKFKTITCDNGVEFLDSKGIESCKRSNQKRTTLFYCHPYSSYERGTNENINRLIRRFYPKGYNFDNVSNSDIERLQNWINNYPRKIFGGLSSSEYKNMVLCA